VRGELPDGTSIELQAAHGILEVPEIEHQDEGPIEANPKIKGILLGVSGIKKLRTIVNGCKSLLAMEKC